MCGSIFIFIPTGFAFKSFVTRLQKIVTSVVTPFYALSCSLPTESLKQGSVTHPTDRSRKTRPLFYTVMANVPPMGPPPSPKEPRRSGRRSVPSHSSSKSPVPSPHPESTPRLKENRPALPSLSSSRSKRSKQEEVDETFEDVSKLPPNHQNNGRNKRKPKDKPSTPTLPSIDTNPAQKEVRVSEEPADTSAQEEEGVTRCICGNAGSFNSWPYPALLTSCLSFTPPQRTSLIRVRSWFSVTFVGSGNI